MALREFSSEFTPYVDPDEWGGHMIGQCPPEPRPIPPHDKASYRFATDTLREQLPTMPAPDQLDGFQTDGSFAAKDYHPGTIALFKDQALQRPQISTVPRALTHVEPVLALNLDKSEGYPQKLYENRLILSKHVWWGVVAKTKRGDATIISFAAHDVFKTSDSEVVVTNQPSVAPPRIEIGKTEHLVDEDSEWLWKPTLLYICAHGKAKRVRRPLSRILNRIVDK